MRDEIRCNPSNESDGLPYCDVPNSNLDRSSSSIITHVHGRSIRSRRHVIIIVVVIELEVDFALLCSLC